MGFLDIFRRKPASTSVASPPAVTVPSPTMRSAASTTLPYDLDDASRTVTPEVNVSSTSQSEAQMLRELAQKTASDLRCRGIEPTRFGNGKGTFVDAWNLGIMFDSHDEEVLLPRGFRHSYKYDQLLLKPDGQFYVRNCWSEETNDGKRHDYNFWNTSEHELLSGSDLSASQIVTALENLVSAQ